MPIFYLTLLFLLTSAFSIAQSNHLTTAIILENHTAADFKSVVGELSNAQGIEILRKHNPVIHFQYQTENNRRTAMEMLQNRDFNITTKTGLPIDFPLAVNDEETTDEYHQQKSEWIAAHPERYAALNQPTGITTIPQEEFDQMSPEKQEHILEHPELYLIEQ